MSDQLTPCRISVGTILSAVSEGWAAYRRCLVPAAGFAGVFMLIGVGIFGALAHFGLSAMMLPFAGGFLLVGPAVLAGFFALRRAVAAGRGAGFADVLSGFRQAPRGLWGLAAACSLLLLIWLTDAATVYSFMIGGTTPDAGQVARFHLWTSLMGAVLAFIVFNITAFAVPLLFDGRASLVQAVTASVRGVFANPAPMLVWAVLLAGAIIATILFPPLLLVSLPCLAFASDLLYLQVFPPAGG
ncbi:DUF2189 domain-containing protein [Zoogloea sp. 1C4]|uniref:DUF2189 domain-containing protein n=1 Tax=Zoogloea sp. 1C4 TaxID=2570190 RepID=UPI00129180F7|nr:DUF2189 domain-containing protein [Zoogloea sp. 1C4]